MLDDPVAEPFFTAPGLPPDGCNGDIHKSSKYINILLAMKTSRRRLLQAAAFTPAAAVAAAPAVNRTAVSPSTLYTSLGVKPVINGVGVVTVLGGSLMPPEVVQAMEEAGRYFIPLPELQKKVGARLAELLQAPAGCA